MAGGTIHEEPGARRDSVAPARSEASRVMGMDEARKEVGVRRPMAVFLAWLCGASVVVGVGLTLQTAYALRAFGALGRSFGIVAVALLRGMAPHVAAAAACAALAAWAHWAG